MYMMNMAKRSDTMYSTRPYPNGCTRSALFMARSVETMMNTAETESDRLFTASSRTAFEPMAMPVMSFPANNPALTLV